MTRKAADARRGKLRAARVAISIAPLTKGQRAKHGRRREYKTVFLNGGIIDRRELEAIEGLQLLTRRDFSKVDVETPTVLPSSDEGLSGDVARFAAFVSKNVAVEFRAAQIAHALQISEETLTFAVKVLATSGVLTRRDAGAWLWTGTDALQRRLETIGETPKTIEDPFAAFCEKLLNLFAETKASRPLVSSPVDASVAMQEPLPLSRMAATLRNGDASIDAELRCVCAVLRGVGAIDCLCVDAEECYAIPSVIAEAQRPTPPPPSLPSEMLPPASPFFSLPVVVDKKREDMTPDAPSPTLSPCPQQRSSREKLPNITQAAVMEIVGNEITQVGIVDVLGQGSLTTHCAQHTGTNSVIALAVPQWMLTRHRQGFQAPRSAQIYAFDASFSLNKPFAIESQQPMHMSCIPVPRGSLLELLSHTLTGHGDVRKPDCAHSYSVQF